MDDDVREALARDRTIDITTTGRRSGRPQRIEIWFHALGDRVYITGTPGRRGWYANLVAEPEFVFHLKDSLQADLPARARPVTEPAERREVVTGIRGADASADELEAWVSDSPIVEVEFLGEHDDAGGATPAAPSR